MKKNSIPRKILLAIGEKSKDLLVGSATILFDPKTVMKGTSLYCDHRFRSIDISKGIWNLKKSGYLKTKKIENKEKLYLTSKGRVEIIKDILKEKKEKELSWDGKWRAIIFDVPEASRRDRDFLRRELLLIGFKELQKSVWVYPYETKKELRTLLGLWKIDFAGDIRFLTIEDMNDKDLRKQFNLG